MKIPSNNDYKMKPKQNQKPEKMDQDSKMAPPQADPALCELEFEKRILRLSRIDIESFEVLYRKYHPQVYRWIIFNLHDEDIAHNLTDETFSRAVSGLDRFHWRGIKIGTWIFKIAYNVVGEHFRRTRTRSEVPYDPDYHEPEDPTSLESEIEAFGDSRILMSCVEKLPVVRKEVIVSFYGSGRRTREIAEMMKIPESTVKSHLQRGRDQLRECLVRKGIDRGLSETATKVIKEATVKKNQWEVLEAKNETSSENDKAGEEKGDRNE